MFGRCGAGETSVTLRAEGEGMGEVRATLVGRGGAEGISERLQLESHQYAPLLRVEVAVVASLAREVQSGLGAVEELVAQQDGAIRRILGQGQEDHRPRPPAPLCGGVGGEDILRQAARIEGAAGPKQARAVRLVGVGHACLGVDEKEGAVEVKAPEVGVSCSGLTDHAEIGREAVGQAFGLCMADGRSQVQQQEEEQFVTHRGGGG